MSQAVLVVFGVMSVYVGVLGESHVTSGTVTCSLILPLRSALLVFFYLVLSVILIVHFSIPIESDQCC